jgi:hypothetical protein
LTKTLVMKKFLLALLLLSSYGHAQDSNGNGIPTVFAFTFGPAYSTVAPIGNSTFAGKGWLAGYRGAFSLAVPVVEGFAVRTELGFASTGAADSRTGYNLRFSSFEIPLLACFNVAALGDLHLMIGPQIGHLLSANETNAGVKTGAFQAYNAIDYSAVAGVEWLPGSFGVALRYVHGFTDIGRSDALAGRTRSFSVGLVWRVNKK